VQQNIPAKSSALCFYHFLHLFLPFPSEGTSTGLDDCLGFLPCSSNSSSSVLTWWVHLDPQQ
jgi:hypothetical protein